MYCCIELNRTIFGFVNLTSIDDACFFVHKDSQTGLVDFNQFIKANEKYGRDDIDNIAREVGGQIP